MSVSTRSVFCVLGVLTGLVSAAPDVPLTRGILKGQDENAVTTQKPLHAYYGIPFAQPPLGSLRFKPPVPFYATDPNQVVNSDTYREICIQALQSFSPTPRPQSEDCLYLNVFTPSVGTDGAFSSTPTKKMMFFIHGGGFISGDASLFRPTRLVTDFDVIVVIPQYRLGPFGFLGSGDDVLPDQILALQWVKDNIGRFGGDPDDITMFGESAGSVGVQALTLSPLTKGLFTKAIFQSGSLLSPTGVNAKPEMTFYSLAKSAGCLPSFYIPYISPSYNHQVLNCLEKLPARALQTAGETMDLGTTSPLDISEVSFTPVVDGQVLPREPFSLVEDSEYMRQIGALDRKYMIGNTNNEGLLLAQILRFAGWTPDDLIKEEAFEEALTKRTQPYFPFPVTSEVMNFVRLTYAFPRDWQGKPQFQGWLDFNSDTSFIIPSYLWARSLVRLSSLVDVYQFLFDHYPELKDPNGVIRGSAHAFALNYLFDEKPGRGGFVSYYANVWTPGDLPLLDIFRGFLAKFAQTGNPSLAGYAAWPRYDLQNKSYMAVRVTPEVRQNMYDRRVSLWTDFLPRVAGAIFSNGPRQKPIRI